MPPCLPRRRRAQPPEAAPASAQLCLGSHIGDVDVSKVMQGAQGR